MLNRFLKPQRLTYLPIARLPHKYRGFSVTASVRIDNSLDKGGASEPTPTDDKSSIETKKSSALIEIPDENPNTPRECVFQQITKKQASEPIYTMEDAALPEDQLFESKTWRYPKLANHHHGDTEYCHRGVDNADTLIHQFPSVSDFIMVGGGLVSAAAAYYSKKMATRLADVCVFDKDPYSCHNTTALSNGLISSQSKCRDISRIATLSKELIRDLRNDILVNDEDFAKIMFRPCTHLILWPESEVKEVMEAVDFMIDDSLHTQTLLPGELEVAYPWLNVSGTDVVLGTRGCQDEVLVDPIALRNLYRTLAQAHGASFIKGEVIDFNNIWSRETLTLNPLSTTALVARIPATGELRNVGFAHCLISLGHNTPFLEERSPMETYMRDKIEDLHFIQPKLRVYFSFYSLDTPLINFPVITDTDGSVLIRDDFTGEFKYYLNYDDSAILLDADHERFHNFNSEDPHPNLIHKDEMFVRFFEENLKPRLVNRIPKMVDAKFNFAFSGFECCNTIDGSPVVGPHPWHERLSLSAGYGSRMMIYAPFVGKMTSEIMISFEPTTYDANNLYWNRIIARNRVKEFSSLIR